MRTHLITLIAAVAALVSCTSKPQNQDYYVAAVIWPSCHNDSLAREHFWSEGIGEWEMVQKGDPRFEGHYQPKRPLWGYEMDNDPKVMEKWIDAATSHGVNTFIFDWYWYNDYPYLESCLNDGFLGAANNGKMNFYIMWANHNVPGNMWNYHRYGPDYNDLVFSGCVTPEQYEKLVDRWITKYFSRPNYLKIDGKPVFWIYDVNRLLESFGNDEDKVVEALAYLDRKCVEAGFNGVRLQTSRHIGVTTAGITPWHIDMFKNDSKLYKKLGFSDFAIYTMGGLGHPGNDYLTYGCRSIEIRQVASQLLDMPVIPTVSVGWDNTPRYPQKGEEYVCHVNRTPEIFKLFLQIAKDYVDRHPNQPRLIILNAWNEWIEDAYLLPDEVYGFSYLDAVKEVFE